MKKLIAAISTVMLLTALGIMNRGMIEPNMEQARTTRVDQRSTPMHPEMPLVTESQQWMEESFGAGSSSVLMALKKSGKLYIPAVGLRDALAQAELAPEPPGPAAGGFQYGGHMVRTPLPNGGAMKQAAVYTELKWLNHQEFIREVEAREWLEEIVHFPEADGVALNPNTRFLSDHYPGVLVSANRFAVAELIGFVSAADSPGQPYHELANQAYDQGKYYEVLYYWGRSFRTPRPGDDWKRAEAAKLRAYYALDFPGSRERARNELEWMTNTHPDENLEDLRTEFAQS